MVSRAFVRVSILSIVVILSIVALALGGALTSSTNSNFKVTFAYASLAIAAGVISTVTVGPMILLELISPGSTTVIFEVCWLTFLWILWLASGIVSAQMGKNYGILGGEVCQDKELDKAFPVLSSICSQTTGIVALSFVIWVILFGYTAMLANMAVSASKGGNGGSWTSSFAQGPGAASTSGGDVVAAPWTQTHTTHAGKDVDAYESASSLKTGTVQV